MPGVSAVMKYAVGVLAVLVVLLGAAWQHERLAHAKTKAKAQERMAYLLERAAQAEAAHRKSEKELSDASIEHSAKVESLLAENRRAARRSAVASERLREQAAKFAAQGGARCADPTSPPDIEAGQSPAMVLADVLGRIDARASKLAAGLDDARARGLACEADYERARQALTQQVP